MCTEGLGDVCQLLPAGGGGGARPAGGHHPRPMGAAGPVAMQPPGCAPAWAPQGTPAQGGGPGGCSARACTHTPAGAASRGLPAAASAAGSAAAAAAAAASAAAARLPPAPGAHAAGAAAPGPAAAGAAAAAAGGWLGRRRQQQQQWRHVGQWGGCRGAHS